MMCVCVGYGCVFFLWVCGILGHNSCSSQVTALFSRTYLAFLPRHDYHTPSTLATRNISIIPKWNWSNVPEMSNLNSSTTPLLLFIPHSLSLPRSCLLPITPPCSVQIPVVLQKESSGRIFSPDSDVGVCRCVRVISQWLLFSDLLLGKGRRMEKIVQP